jgi:hypothetical protein
MKLFASIAFAVTLACAALPARADVPTDPCMSATMAGGACNDPVTGNPGACVANPGGGYFCQAGATPTTSSSTTSTASGSTTGGSQGGGGSGGSSSGGSSGGCSTSGIGGIGFAPIAGALALMAGAMLRRKRRRD